MDSVRPVFRSLTRALYYRSKEASVRLTQRDGVGSDGMPQMPGLPGRPW